VNTRVTSQTQTNNSITYIRQRSAELAKYQDQVSSGLRVSKPSDDPTAFPAISQVKAASLRLDAYSQNVSDSTSVLNAGVSTLQSVNDILVKAKQIALEGADATANTDPNSIEALATQVDGLIDQALKAANSQPDGKTIFGGTAITTAPFSVATTDAQGRPATIAYNGATDRTRTLTGPGQTVDTRYVGSDVFQKPGADVFQSLITLRDNLRSTTLTGAARAQAFAQNQTDLDAARNQIGSVTAEQSSNLATLDTVANLTSEVKLTADQRLGDLEGTDYAEAVVKMQEQQTTLQAIYATTTRILQPGLLDFIQ
jgi:flagellin-like hook-associated protein FlgL